MKAVQLFTLLAVFVFTAASAQAFTKVKITDQVKVERIDKAVNSFTCDGDEKKAKKKSKATKKETSCTTQKSCCKSATKTNHNSCDKTPKTTGSCKKKTDNK